MSPQVMRILLTMAVVVIVALVRIYVQKVPNRSKKNPAAQRLSKIIPIAGWPILVVGSFLTLVAFTANDEEDLLPMRLAGIGVTLLGGFLVMIYRNFYVIPGEREVHMRGLFGRQQRIVYREIDHFEVSPSQNGPVLKVRSIDGSTLALAMNIYRLDPLIDHLEQHGTRTQPPQSVPR